MNWIKNVYVFSALKQIKPYMSYIYAGYDAE